MITGKEIKELRKAKKMSQVEFAKIVGVSSKSIMRWENGQTCPYPLAVEKLEKIKIRLA